MKFDVEGIRKAFKITKTRYGEDRIVRKDGKEFKTWVRRYKDNGTWETTVMYTTQLKRSGSIIDVMGRNGELAGLIFDANAIKLDDLVEDNIEVN